MTRSCFESQHTLAKYCEQVYALPALTLHGNLRLSVCVFLCLNGKHRPLGVLTYCAA